MLLIWPALGMWKEERASRELKAGQWPHTSNTLAALPPGRSCSLRFAHQPAGQCVCLCGRQTAALSLVDFRSARSAGRPAACCWPRADRLKSVHRLGRQLTLKPQAQVVAPAPSG